MGQQIVLASDNNQIKISRRIKISILVIERIFAKSLNFVSNL